MSIMGALIMMIGICFVCVLQTIAYTNFGFCVFPRVMDISEDPGTW